MAEVRQYAALLPHAGETLRFGIERIQSTAQPISRQFKTSRSSPIQVEVTNIVQHQAVEVRPNITIHR